MDADGDYVCPRCGTKVVVIDGTAFVLTVKQIEELKQFAQLLSEDEVI